MAIYRGGDIFPTQSAEADAGHAENVSRTFFIPCNLSAYIISLHETESYRCE